MIEQNKQYGLQASGEKNRTPEFKDSRNNLISNINSWLITQANKYPKISDNQLITETVLGPVNHAVDMVGVSHNIGTSLRGNGVETPIEFQRVYRNEKDELEVIQISGTDPLANMARNGVFAPGYRQEKVAFFRLETLRDDGFSNYFEYEFGGDGSVTQRFITDDGTHIGRVLSTPDDIEMASIAFSQVSYAATT